MSSLVRDRLWMAYLGFVIYTSITASSSSHASFKVDHTFTTTAAMYIFERSSTIKFRV